MGQLVIQYPDAKAVYLYYGLAKSYGVPLEERDPGTGDMVPRSNAAIKADVDAAVRQRQHERIKAVYASEDAIASAESFESSFIDPELS